MRSLDRDSSFLLLWSGQTVSELGSAVTALALPTAAILLFGAGPVEVGILSALQVLPFLGLGLLFGPVLDRVLKRPVLIACDAARLVLLASIPIAAALHVLGLNQLYAVALLAGCADVIFQVAYQAHLPQLVGREQLMGANSRMYVSGQAAHTLGPALAGILIQALSAARAIALDAASYGVSLVTIALIPRPEPAPPPRKEGAPGFRAQLAEGLVFVLGHRVLRRIAAGNATFTVGARMVEGLYLIYCYRVLHLSPALVGAIMGLATAATVGGALLRPLVYRWLGFGPALVIAQLVMGLCLFLIPLGVPGLILSGILLGVASGSFDIGQLTLRQLLTPDRLQARMNATMRTLFWGPRPLAFLAGGVLATWIGVVPTLLVAAVVATVGTGFWAMPEVLAMKKPPVPVTEG